MRKQQPDNQTVPAHLEQLLRQHEASLRLSECGQLLVKFFSAIACMLLLMVALDHSFSAGLSWIALRAAGVVLILAGLFAVGMVARATLRQVNAHYVARHLEKSRGVAHNAVLNWLFVRENHAIQYAVATGATQAEAELAAPTGEEFSIRAGRSHWTAVLAVAAAWLLFSIITPKEIAPSLRRLFGSYESAPSATQIFLRAPVPENAVYVGEPLNVEFEIRGRAAGELSFAIVDPKAGPDGRALVRHSLIRTVPTGKPDLRAITLTGNEIAGDLHFRANAGDCELTGIIPVRPTPEVVQYDIEITPPKYLGLPVSNSKSPEIHAYVGSEAAWRISGNSPLHNPVFVFRGATETRTRMTVNGNEPRLASVTLPLTESGAYWIEFADPWGRNSARGTPHRVVLQGDQVPRVELVEPSVAAGAADTVDLANAPWLRVAASDDWQLKSLELVLERSGVIERRDFSLERTRPGEVIQLGIASAEIELAVGQSMKAWFEARDNRQTPTGEPAPQLGRSAVLTLRRSSENAIERGGKKAEPEVAQADSGTVVETASAVKKLKGSGKGDDGTATGDGPGENPSDKSGPEGGTARPSDSGSSATTDQPSDPENSATIGREAGPDQPGAGTSDTDAETGNSSSGEKSGQGEGDGDGEGGGEGGESAPIEKELKKFLERHGDDVKQAKESLDRKGLNSSNAETSSPPREREDSTEDPKNGESAPQEPQPTAREQKNATSKADDVNEAGEPKKEKDLPSRNDKSADPPKRVNDETPHLEGEPTEGKAEQQNSKDGKDGTTGEQSPKESEPRNQEGRVEPKPPSSADQNAADKSDTTREKSPSNAAEAPKPQPNAPANDKSKPDPAPPNLGKSEPNDSPSTPQAGKKGDPANGPAGEQLPEGELDSSRSASPGAVSLPGGKVDAEPSEGPGAPVQNDGPISKQSGESKENQPKSDMQNLLELLERSEAIGPEALDDLPWPTDKKAAFLRDLKRLDSLSKLSSNQAAIQRWREGRAIGSRETQYGRGSAVAGAVGESTMQVDSLEKLASPPDQKVPPHLRQVLDAYYRSLANRRPARQVP